MNMNRENSNGRIILMVLMVGIIAFASVSAFAADDVTVYVNGKKIVSDVPATIVNSRTMLPFRAVFNALGVNDDAIKWHQGSRSIEVSSGGKYIFLAVGNSGALVNDTLVALDSPPYITESRTMIPVRFVSEALGADVDWNDKTRVVTITKK